MVLAQLNCIEMVKYFQHPASRHVPAYLKVNVYSRPIRNRLHECPVAQHLLAVSQYEVPLLLCDQAVN